MQSLESKIQQSERERNKNDKTLETSSNLGQLWLPDEVDALRKLAGDMRPEEIAIELDRSYYGTTKKAENEDISLAMEEDRGNGYTPQTREASRPRRKVHKVIYTPIMRHGIIVGQKRREMTIYEYIDEGEK